MSDGKERIQLNLRLDGYKELYDAVKVSAAEQDTSVNQFVINALKAALGWEVKTSIPHKKTEAIEQRLALLEERLASVSSVESRLEEMQQQLGEFVA